MSLKPVELVHREIMAEGPGNPHFALAASFEKSCAQLWGAEVGQNLIRYLAAHAHPCKHIPYADPYTAAIAQGRAEIVAFITMMASPDDIPQLATLTQPEHEPQQTVRKRAGQTRTRP